ncbi:MAG TPA: hypothetical protein VIV11_24060 [Kofleriaceae bacterium]
MMGRIACCALVVLAGCYTSTAPAPPPPPPYEAPPPADPPVHVAPSGGFAQAPPGGSPVAQTPPASLPTTGPECVKDCPNTAPLYPTEDCRDGIHTGGRGPCVRFANGCNWSGLVCPAASPRVTCKPTDCDLPIPSQWLCPDGKSIGSFTCVASDRGTCGATYQACPFTPKVVKPPPAPPPQPKRACNPLPSDRELATWPVGEWCGFGGGPAQPDTTIVKQLKDGTQIIEQLGHCRRVRQVSCHTKCLPPDARIATPSGDVAIRDVRIGTEIWTRDTNGRRVATRVELVNSVEITGEHHVARLELADGRTLTVSPQHPALDGLVQDFRVGDAYDGSSIVKLDFLRYTGARTYDLRPAGASGIYWADDIPLRSTLD